MWWPDICDNLCQILVAIGQIFMKTYKPWWLSQIFSRSSAILSTSLRLSSRISGSFSHIYLAKPCLSSQIFGQAVLASSYRCGRDIPFLSTTSSTRFSDRLNTYIGATRGDLAILLDKGGQHFFLPQTGADRLLFGAGCSYSAGGAVFLLHRRPFHWDCSCCHAQKRAFMQINVLEIRYCIPI